MIVLIRFVLAVLASPFKSKSRLEAKNAVLRHQLIVLQRKVRGRAHLTNDDRWFFVQMYRWFPSILKVVTIIEPETLVRWHRAGFRRYWRWKSRSLGGRPQIEIALRALIRQMSMENLLWGAPLVPRQARKSGAHPDNRYRHRQARGEGSDNRQGECGKQIYLRPQRVYRHASRSTARKVKKALTGTKR
jgi:hypothetical protein